MHISLSDLLKPAETNEVNYLKNQAPNEQIKGNAFSEIFNSKLAGSRAGDEKTGENQNKNPEITEQKSEKRENCSREETDRMDNKMTETVKEGTGDKKTASLKEQTGDKTPLQKRENAVLAVKTGEKRESIPESGRKKTGEISVSLPKGKKEIKSNLKNLALQKKEKAEKENTKKQESHLTDEKLEKLFKKTGLEEGNNLKLQPDWKKREPKKETDVKESKTDGNIKETSSRKTAPVREAEIVKVLVVDMRKEPDNAKKNTEIGDKKVKPALSADSALGTKKKVDFEYIGRFNVRVQEKHTDLRVDSTPRQKMESAFVKKFENFIQKDMIRQTGIFLRDNGRGEIKLVLKPENLGSVRIRVEMDNNNIAGRIIVENDRIKEIFESNMNNILNAFREDGFESASLEISVGSRDAGREEENKEGNYARETEEFEKYIPGASISEESQINVYV